MKISKSATVKLKSELINVVLVIFLTLLFTIYFFISADRNIIFLYGHFGAMPFDQVTVGRYLVAGWVISGIIFITYTLTNLFIKKLQVNYQLPDWQIVWQLSSSLLFLPILLILIKFGQPTLPLLLALAVEVTLFTGMRWALLVGDYFLHQPRQAIFTFLDAGVLIPALILLPLSIDFALRKSSPLTVIIVAIITIASGFIGSLFVNLLRKKKKCLNFSATKIFCSTLLLAYGGGSLFHYLTSRTTDIYISTTNNFIANNLLVELLSFGVVLTMLWIIMKWRKNNNWQGIKKELLILGGLMIFGYTALYLAK